MGKGYFKIEMPENEHINSYAPGTKERETLKKELDSQANKVVKIPLIIGGKEVWTEKTAECRMPHDHGHVLAEYCLAGEKELKAAIEAAMDAKAEWEAMATEHRLSIFLKAADLLAGPWRDKCNAATMLGQSKTAFQAEIDSACELADFLRFNVYFAQQIYEDQPNNSPGVWNRSEYRPLEGFVTAISPFNFTAIGGNLSTAPAMMGNVVLWKPASTAVLSNYYVMKILMEAGLPAGVINFLPSAGSDISKFVLSDPRLAGFHFTGSTEVFSQVWSSIGENIKKYVSYPRIVGETGGKDFIFAHKTSPVKPLVSALARGAFEYQGQKCSAASRAYIPESIWPQVEKELLTEVEKLKIGDVRDFTNFMGAVIDEESYNSIKGYIDHAKSSQDAELICGGYDDTEGWFIKPTIIKALTPDFKTMVEEIFGPVLTIYVYPDEEFEETMEICDKGSAYALTGAIFAKDRQVIEQMEAKFAHSAGNFYINDKPTGAVVGQQPFGGSRASGTNDKAGSMLNLYRWINPRTIKETFVPVEDIAYPFMEEK